VPLNPNESQFWTTVGRWLAYFLMVCLVLIVIGLALLLVAVVWAPLT
jgi:hypothetical protein